MTEAEPSVTRWASLLLSALAAAYGAMVELRDCGYAHTTEGDKFVATYHQATQMAAEVFQQLNERREELLADPELEPILQAIALVSEECNRLTADAKEQADIDAQFVELVERLKESG